MDNTVRMIVIALPMTLLLACGGGGGGGGTAAVSPATPPGTGDPVTPPPAAVTPETLPVYSVTDVSAHATKFNGSNPTAHGSESVFWLLGVFTQPQRSPTGSYPESQYEMTLWRPAFWYAFPNAPSPSRKTVHRPFDCMRLLRNRIAHHEPIYARRLDKDYRNVLNVLNWMSPEVRVWVEASSRILDLLTQFGRPEHVKF